MSSDEMSSTDQIKSEVEAMGKIADILEGLTEYQNVRILAWATEVFLSHKSPLSK